MATLPIFDPPANWDDFQDNAHRDAFRSLWSSSVNGWTNESITGGDPPGDNDRSFYYNPLTTDMSNAVGAPAVIRWTAFPNRLILNYPNASQKQLFRYADEGPPDPSYGPRGPRGWQDEYCEISVTRNANNKITKVDFTCENVQYWQAMWLIDESVVLAGYRALVGPQVKLEDLYKRDPNGQVINDPDTMKPAYDPTNIWNRDTKNGAVHLVSAPNNLFAEIYLAAAATILRKDGQGKIVTDKDQLITCSQYGSAGRNSDPTIGAAVNQLIQRGGVKVSLENPVGLYLQTPAFGTYQLPPGAPAGAKASDYWKIVRGSARTNANEPDRILHAVYEVPAGLGFTVGDIKINNAPIEFGSQLMQTLEVALAGVAVSTTDPKQAPRSCLGQTSIAALTSPAARAALTSAARVNPAHLISLAATPGSRPTPRG